METRLDIQTEFKRFPFHVSYTAETIKEACLYDHSPAIKRRENFWTYGSASYKDKDNFTNHEYEAFVAKTNFQLVETFPDLYRYYLEWFEEKLKMPVQYMPGVSIPGFHVFRYDKDFEAPLARPHVDVPFNKFDWGKTIGYHTIFTPVIAVEIPDDAGMFVWDVTAEDIDEHGVEKVLERLPNINPMGLVSHKVDTMLFHSGRFVHQIKPFSGPTDKWRITMQAHAVLMDGVWNIYW